MAVGGYKGVFVHPCTHHMWRRVKGVGLISEGSWSGGQVSPDQAQLLFEQATVCGALSCNRRS